jgi:hypothetical protein
MEDQFRFEDLLERFKNDQVFAVLVLALNEVVTQQTEQERINQLVHTIIANHSEQITKLLEAMGALTKAVSTMSSAIEKNNSNAPTIASYPFRGIEIK